MKTLLLRELRMCLNPAVTTGGSRSAEMNDIGGAPRPTLPTLHAVMEAVRLAATAFAQALRPD